MKMGRLGLFFCVLLVGTFFLVPSQVNSAQPDLCDDVESCNQVLLQLNLDIALIAGNPRLSEVIPGVTSYKEAVAACAARGLEVPEISELMWNYNPAGFSRHQIIGSVPFQYRDTTLYYWTFLFDPELHRGESNHLWSSSGRIRETGKYQFETTTGKFLFGRESYEDPLTHGVRCKMPASGSERPILCESGDECYGKIVDVYQRLTGLGFPRLTGAFEERVTFERAEKVCSAVGMRVPTLFELATALNPAGTRLVSEEGFRQIQPAGESAFYYRDEISNLDSIPRGTEILWSSSRQVSSPALGFVFSWNYGIFVQTLGEHFRETRVRCLR